MGEGIKIDPDDVAKLEAKLRQTTEAAIDGAIVPMTDHARAVLKSAVFINPVWTGALKSTAAFERPQTRGTGNDYGLKIRFGYAFPGTDTMNPMTGLQVSQYAIEVHEEPQKMRYSGVSGFLEIPFNEKAERYFGALARGIGAAFQGLGRG